MNSLYILIATAILAMLISLWRTSPKIAIVFALSSALLEGLFGSFNSVIVAGLEVYPPDLLWLAALLAAIGLPARESSRLNTRLLVLLLLLGLSAAIGAANYGVAQAGNEARVFVYALAPLVYYSKFPLTRHQLRFSLRAFVVLGLIFCGAAYLHWFTNGLSVGASSSPTRVQSGGTFFAGAIRDERALTIREAAVVTQAFLILLLGRRMLDWPSAFTRALSLPLGVAVLLLQHRTLWAGVVVALVMALVVPAAGRPQVTRWLNAVFATSAGIAAYFVAVRLNLGATAAVKASGQAAFAEDSTFIWRVRSWRALLTQDRAPLEWLLGSPFGSGYVRRISVGNIDGLVEVNPHNFYVQIMLRLGFVGCVAFVWLLLQMVRRIYVSHSRDAPAFVAMTALVIALCATYPPAYEQGIALGLILCSLKLQRSANTGVTSDACHLHDHLQPAPAHGRVP